MQTHYHLVLESLDGDLSSTMGWLQSRHGGHFNRTRGYFGPLVGGRFKSITIDSVVYLWVLIRYVDLNPVAAGLEMDPLSYAFGSASWHAHSDSRPPWLARDLCGRFISRAHSPVLDRQAAYRAAFGHHEEVLGTTELVEARLHHVTRARDDLDALLQTDGAGRREWVVRRAREADGTTPGLPMVNVGSVARVVGVHRTRAPGSTVCGAGKRQVPLWEVAEVGLARDLAGLGFAQTAKAFEIGAGTASRRYGYHTRALREDPAYLAILSELVRQALETCFGPRVRLVAEELAETVMSRRGWKDA